MESVAHVCPTCRAQVQEGNFCANCGSKMLEPVVDYPRPQALSRDVKRYGRGYVGVAVGWGLMPLATIAFSILGFGVGVVREGPLSAGLVLLAVYAAQFLASLGLLHGRPWARVLAALHAVVMLGWLGLFLSATYQQLAHVSEWVEAIAFLLAFAEMFLGLSVLWNVWRAWRIDQQIEHLPEPLP